MRLAEPLSIRYLVHIDAQIERWRSATAPLRIDLAPYDWLYIRIQPDTVGWQAIAATERAESIGSAAAPCKGKSFYPQPQRKR